MLIYMIFDSLNIEIFNIFMKKMLMVMMYNVPIMMYHMMITFLILQEWLLCATAGQDLRGRVQRDAQHLPPRTGGAVLPGHQ